MTRKVILLVLLAGCAAVRGLAQDTSAQSSIPGDAKAALAVIWDNDPGASLCALSLLVPGADVDPGCASTQDRKYPVQTALEKLKKAYPKPDAYKKIPAYPESAMKEAVKNIAFRSWIFEAVSVASTPGCANALNLTTDKCVAKLADDAIDCIYKENDGPARLDEVYVDLQKNQFDLAYLRLLQGALTVGGTCAFAKDWGPADPAQPFPVPPTLTPAQEEALVALRSAHQSKTRVSAVLTSVEQHVNGPKSAD
jgi:hypothetical protein